MVGITPGPEPRPEVRGHLAHAATHRRIAGSLHVPWRPSPYRHYNGHRIRLRIEHHRIKARQHEAKAGRLEAAWLAAHPPEGVRMADIEGILALNRRDRPG